MLDHVGECGVTSISNAEGEKTGKVKDVPFLPEDKIISLGSKYVKAEQVWGVSYIISQSQTI